MDLLSIRRISVFACIATAVGIAVPSVLAQTPKPPSQDAAKIVSAIQASYYHPDELTGLDCQVKVDWTGFFERMKMEVPPERLAVLNAVKVRSRALRDQPAKIDVEWGGPPPEGSPQMGQGLQQMISGFYQMYWPMVARSPIQKASDVTRSELQPDGTWKVFSESPGVSMVLLLDKQMTPVRFDADFPGMKAGFAVHYEDSARPVPGDLRRITGMDVTEQMGSSNINMNLKLDYQPVDTFFVPRKVTMEVVGAYVIDMNFEACAVLKPEAVAPPATAIK